MDSLEKAKDYALDNEYKPAFIWTFIALVERLDKLMATDKDNNKAVRVVEGRK